MISIGQQIKKLRRLRKMSLTQLAETSGVQIATLSRMENGKMTGTIESHLAISKALGISITDLFETMGGEPSSPLTPEDKLDIITTSNDKVSTRILAREASNKKMLPVLMKIEAGASTDMEKGDPGSERFIFVLEGSVILKVKDQKVTLSKNTSLYFNAAQPHAFENPGGTATKFLCITTPMKL